MDGPRADDDDRPEPVLLPPAPARAEVELVLSRLGIVVPVRDAAVPPQRPELRVGAAARPLSEGGVRAEAATCEVAHYQDALEPEWRNEVDFMGKCAFLCM